MRPSALPLAGSLLILGLAFLGPRANGTAPPAWGIAAPVPAVFLQQAGGPFPAAPHAPGRQTVLPSSVLPHTELECSVDTSDPGPAPQCSVLPGAPNGQTCSAHCDSGSTCSAFNVPGDPGAPECSVYGANVGDRCSILQPPRPEQGVTLCSTTNSESIATPRCSILADALSNACSAQNPSADRDNFCSAATLAIGATASCSVLSGGTTTANFCTVGKVGGRKLCSVAGFFGSGDGVCSIQPGNVGLCTALVGAPLNSCSVLKGGGDCSVIGVSQGSRCEQP